MITGTTLIKELEHFIQKENFSEQETSTLLSACNILKQHVRQASAKTAEIQTIWSNRYDHAFFDAYLEKHPDYVKQYTKEQIENFAVWENETRKTKMQYQSKDSNLCADIITLIKEETKDDQTDLPACVWRIEYQPFSADTAAFLQDNIPYEIGALWVHIYWDNGEIYRRAQFEHKTITTRYRRLKQKNMYTWYNLKEGYQIAENLTNANAVQISEELKNWLEDCTIPPRVANLFV